MKKNYEKPEVLQNGSFTEGVYMASGCYKTTAYIHQKPETGRGDYRIQVDAHHDASHGNTKQTFKISFNQNVNFVSCNGNGAQLISGDGTTTLVLSFTYYQNKTDNIGFGDLIVTSDAGLEIVDQSVIMTDDPANYW